MMFRRRRAASPKPFRFWFNNSEAASTKQANKTHMAKVETLVKTLRQDCHRTIQLQVPDEGQLDQDPLTFTRCHSASISSSVASFSRLPGRQTPAPWRRSDS